MGVVLRVIRNLIRSPLRTGAIVAILSVSIGLALIMVTVHGATENQLGSIGQQIGTEITVQPAGRFGMMGGNGTLAQEDVDKINYISHVVSVRESVQTQYTGDSLESAVEQETPGGQGGGPGGGSFPNRFRMGIIVMGFDAATENPTLMGGGQMNITEGRYFTTDDTDADVMVVGKALADKNSLAIGSTVAINGTQVEVIGIYDSSQVFGNNMLVMPIGAVQSLFDLKGATSVTVQADDVKNVNGVVSSIREIFPTSVADVTTAQNMYQRINSSVANAENTSTIGMIAGFAVAVVVILFSLVLMVRQRVKEIGILKAIGASNRQIGFQLGGEALAMSVMAAIIGTLITYLLAQKVANLLGASPAGGFGTSGGGGLFGGGVTSVAGINVAVSPEVFLYALGIAIALAVAASIFPARYISRVKPAEVLRYE
ncbi:MAG: FtsX-like permease family protein [Dehalococcoidia bacterium]